MNLEKIPQMQNEEPEKSTAGGMIWAADFIRLNQNYQDYMRELNSVKVEQMMKTQEFLIFKDRLIEYLRSFVKACQDQCVGDRAVPEEYRRTSDNCYTGERSRI